MIKLYTIAIIGILSASIDNNILYEYDFRLEPHQEYKADKIYTSKVINGQPKIDGLLIDNCWNAFYSSSDSEIINDFIQDEPNNLSSPTFETQVIISHDNDYIYIAARLFDSNPSEIMSQMSRRDDWDLMSSDAFLIEFDSMHDHQTSYFFAVNSSGVQLDGATYLDFDDDIEYNAIWESGVSIHGDGWSLEMKIPFKMLNITQIKNPWGMNIHRSIPRFHEYNSWVTFPRDISGVASQFGHIFGFEQIDIRTPIEVKPYITTGRHISNNNFLKDDQLYGDILNKEKHLHTHNNIGLDLKYRISSASSADIAINPDFGQVEMDPEYINLSYYEIYLPEKRQFFSEIGSIFNTPVELLYSRRIGSDDQFGNSQRINLASKIKGNTKSGFEYGAFISNTGPDSLDFDILDDDGIDYNAYRLARNHNIFNVPMYTGLTKLSYDGIISTWSIDNSIYAFNDNLIIDYQYISQNKASSNFGHYFNISYFSPFPIFFNITSEHYGKNLDLNKMGFLYRNNLQSTDFNIGFKNRAKSLSFVRKFKIDIDRSIHRNLNQLKLKDDLGIKLSLYFSNYSKAVFGYSLKYESYDDYYMYDYEIQTLGPPFLKPEVEQFYFVYKTDYSNRYILNLGFELGESINKDYLIDSRLELTSKISEKNILKLSVESTLINNKYHFLESVINDINPSTEDSIEHIFASIKGWETRYGVRYEQYLSSKLSLQFYSEYFQRFIKYGDYKLWKYGERWPVESIFITGGSIPIIGSFSPLYTDGNLAPEIEEDENGDVLVQQYLNPNYYVGFYPRYSSINFNLSLKYEYRPGSEFYFVYTLSKSVNGMIFSNIRDFILNTDLDDWTEEYYHSAFYIKCSYWFDL